MATHRNHLPRSVSRNEALDVTLPTEHDLRHLVEIMVLIA
jgi:hypothetical protein